MAPGPELASMLASVSVAELSEYDQIVVVRAQQRMASHHATNVYQAMTALAETIRRDLDDDLALAHEAAAAEIRVALRLTRRSADHQAGCGGDPVPAAATGVGAAGRRCHRRAPGPGDRPAR